MSRVVIVTGGSSGIGLHMVRTLLDYGYRVAVADLREEPAAELAGRYPDRFLFQICDLTSDQQVEEFVASVIQRWGQIDVLVNNACLAIFKPFEEKVLEETRREFDVNYFGYLRVIAAALPHLKASRGIIHNVSSAVGVTGFSGIYGYASTKGAIEAMTRTLAQEFEPYGVTVNLMHPPLTRTESAAPLGVPAEIMADPAQVGRGLAKKILSRRADMTPGLQAGAFLRMARWFPDGIGRMLSRAAQRAREAEKKQA